MSTQTDAWRFRRGWKYVDSVLIRDNYVIYDTGDNEYPHYVEREGNNTLPNTAAWAISRNAVDAVKWALDHQEFKPVDKIAKRVDHHPKPELAHAVRAEQEVHAVLVLLYIRGEAEREPHGVGYWYRAKLPGRRSR
ncbi:MAG: hypothetical protein HY690_07385 [Chloroflexi bacterium]|nr:hypothetical protein [Chloroflexota bacterium]